MPDEPSRTGFSADLNDKVFRVAIGIGSCGSFRSHPGESDEVGILFPPANHGYLVAVGKPRLKLGGGHPGNDRTIETPHFETEGRCPKGVIEAH